MAAAKKTTTSAAKAPTTAAAAPRKAPAAKAGAKPANSDKAAAPARPAAKKAAPTEDASHTDVPAPRGTTKDGIAYTKDFDIKFLTSQKALLLAEKQALTGQAVRLEDEANSLI